jgi:photosystem II stability/assembly factor-like uncharacterized protein
MTTPASTWQQLASARGGSVVGLAAAGGMVLAATSAGIRRSSDAGLSWTIAGERGGVPFASAVVAAPEFERDQILFAAGAGGAYRSTDGGTSWQLVLSGSVLALAFGRDVLFVGTELDGVLRSDDNGKTWTGANPGVLDLTVLSVALSPHFAEDRMAFLGTASGLYRSRNGGRSWRVVDLDGLEPAVQDLAVSPTFADDRLLFAATEHDGLFRSTDGGSTWSAVSELRGRSVNALAIGAAGQLAAATEEGVAFSADHGMTWRLPGADLPDGVLSLVFAGRVLLAGLLDAGIARSDDDGATWSLLDEDLHARLLVHLTASPNFASDRSLFAADLQRGVCISRDAGQTWSEHDLDLDDWGVADLTAAAGGAIFAATRAGMRRSDNLGASWHRVEGVPPRLVRVVTAADQRVLALLDNAGWLSDDAGATWQEIATPFSVAEAVSALIATDGTLLVACRGADEVVLWRSADNGQRWQRWLAEPTALVDTVALALSPTGTVFVGLSDRVLYPVPGGTEVRGGERRPMWHTTRIANAVVTDLAAPAADMLLVGTNRGVFISRDTGDSFAPWSDDRGPAAVVSLLCPSDGAAYALSLGGSVWRAALNQDSDSTRR